MSISTEERLQIEKERTARLSQELATERASLKAVLDILQDAGLIEDLDDDSSTWITEQIEQARQRAPLRPYQAAHRRVRDLRGKASEHRCVCGERATEWAYSHTDAHEARDQRLVYSDDPWYYVPLCRSCHRIQGLIQRRASQQRVRVLAEGVVLR